MNYFFIIGTTLAVITFLYGFFSPDRISFGNTLEAFIGTYAILILTPFAVFYFANKEYTQAVAERRFSHFFAPLLAGILISAVIGIGGEGLLLITEIVFKIQCHSEGCTYGLVLFFIVPLFVGSTLSLVFSLFFYFWSQRQSTISGTATTVPLATNKQYSYKIRIIRYVLLSITVLVGIGLLLFLTTAARF